MKAEILQIPAEVVPAAWPMALPLLREPIAMSRGCYEPEDVAAGCRAGEYQLWLATDASGVIAAYVGKIMQYPRKRTYFSLFMGGKTGHIDKWLKPLIEAVEAWSKTWGCEALEISGRKGWTRKVEGEVTASHMVREFGPMAEGVH
jgi:hypothetical protein